MSHLVDIFLQPGKVFVDLKEKPTFWLPLLLVSLASGVMVLLYYSTVDPEWFANHMLLASGKDLTAAEMEQVRASMPGARAMGYIGAPSAVIVTVVVSLLYALYFMLAGKIAGAATSFRHGLSLVSWSSMPVLLGVVVAIIGIAMMEPQTGLESLMLTNVDPLLVQLPADHPWSSLAKGFSLLNIWSWFLLALGWRTWTRSGWLQAVIVAVLPSAVIYGVMAMFALL
ncbi:YIP1 family protein [Lysobacter sp. F60174L2]|uniref:YIP1 family protein n=1 Tax=Lysobacter sp. F60174L2 TaxID=3459295 RepID=UPI00403D685F